MIAYDEVSADAQLAASNSFAHPGGPNVRGVLIALQLPITTGSSLTGLTYDGITMPLLFGSLSKATGEPMKQYIAFLGRGVPSGIKTVAWSVSVGTAVLVQVITVTGQSPTRVIDVRHISSDSLVNPEVILRSKGRPCFTALSLISGHDVQTEVNPRTGWTNRQRGVLGTATGAMFTRDAVDTSDVTAGWDQTAEDALAWAVMLSEDRFVNVRARGV